MSRRRRPEPIRPVDEDELNNNPSGQEPPSQAETTNLENSQGKTPVKRRAQLTSRKRHNKPSSGSRFERDHDTLSLVRCSRIRSVPTKTKRKKRKGPNIPDPEDPEISFNVTEEKGEGDTGLEETGDSSPFNDLESNLSLNSLTELAQHFEKELGGRSFVGDGHGVEDGGSFSHFYESLSVEGGQNIVDTAFGLLEVCDAVLYCTVYSLRRCSF